MVLVYTFDKNVYSDLNKVEITLKFYKESIKRAKQLGYVVHIYTNEKTLEPLVDKFFLIESQFSLLWDSFKFKALEKLTDNYILVDGDVFIHKPLNRLLSDVVVDTIEKGNWNLLYSSTVRVLTNLDVKSVIPEWDGSFQSVFSCGVLYFNDLEFKNYYLQSWYKLNEFINYNKKYLDLYEATPVAAQYLLTLLTRKHHKTFSYYSKDLGVSNEYYIHYAGKDKLKGTTILNSKSVI